MDLTFITELYVPVILIACLIVGYCIKHITWLSNVLCEFIPTILACLGAILAVIIAKTTASPIGVETIVYGALTGLASTGMHQLFKQIIEKE